MGYRVTVVNPTGFPLSAEPDDQGHVEYRPRIGGKRVTVHVPDADADDLRRQHDRAIAARHKQALGIREAAKKKRAAASKRAKAKKSANKKPAATKPSKTTAKRSPRASKPKPRAAGVTEYALAVKGPKSSWPTVTGAAVGEHFGVHKREDGQFILTHRPTGHAVAKSRTKKRLVEVGETMTSLLGKAAGTRAPKTLATKIHATKNLSWWVSALTSGETTVAFADYAASIGRA
ncbi:MAG: hypothetical protein ACE37F_00745 [Nannocystaceae bacterium]|nr:hypothetical protein [bacterium]